MNIAVTGATGFIGRYIVRHLIEQGHACRAWHRPQSDRTGLEDLAALTWLEGDLGNSSATAALVDGCDAVVHAALYHPGGDFRVGQGELQRFVEKNVLGTIQLIEAARRAQVAKFIFISSCAVHERILDDRPLDETHPVWPLSHYGAHKAAIEQFVHSYGFGQGYEICALRPTGVYGLAHPAQGSKWFDLVRAVSHGEEVNCRRGGKEVHAADVAKAVQLLLSAPNVAGEAYNCCDRYVSEWDVAHLAKRILNSNSQIAGCQTSPKHQIVTDKLKRLGMQFGGEALLQQTIQQLVAETTS
ncbi:MAG: NAD(P)-dependent oxidoreductase [Pirellulales bacterium]|nr:NAD(P)-dependent oxidoreductase [Pirellulales bacterium]